jgi:hypothetical protein
MTHPDPMTATEAREYGPQWGSYMTSGDPGYIMYTAIPPEEAAHRDTMVAYLKEHCLPIAERNAYAAVMTDPDSEEPCEDDVDKIDRMVAYLEALTFA